MTIIAFHESTWIVRPTPSSLGTRLLAVFIIVMLSLPVFVGVFFLQDHICVLAIGIVVFVLFIGSVANILIKINHHHGLVLTFSRDRIDILYGTDLRSITTDEVLRIDLRVDDIRIVTKKGESVVISESYFESDRERVTVHRMMCDCVGI